MTLDAVLLESEPSYQIGYRHGFSGLTPEFDVGDVVNSLQSRQDSFTVPSNIKDGVLGYFCLKESHDLSSNKIVIKPEEKNKLKLGTGWDKYHIEDKKSLETQTYYLRGYADGVTRFAQSKGMETYFLRALLASAEGIDNFSRGLRLQEPLDIDSDYQSVDNTPKNLTREFLNTIAYKYGFAVRIAKDYGVVIQLDDVPTDPFSHLTFMKALTDDKTPIVLVAVSHSKKELSYEGIGKISTHEDLMGLDSLSSEEKVVAAIINQKRQEDSYKLGLRLRQLKA